VTVFLGRCARGMCEPRFTGKVAHFDVGTIPSCARARPDTVIVTLPQKSKGESK
jgi:hypothetical protein